MATTLLPRENRSKLLAALFFFHLLLWRRRTGWDYLLALFCVVVTASICWCAIPIPRYALAIVFCAFLLAGLAACYSVELLPRRWLLRPLGSAALLAIILISLVPIAIDYTRQFRDDSRQLLRGWVMKNVPAGATIIADRFAGLTFMPYGTPADDLQSRVNLGIESFANDFGSLDSLQQRWGNDLYVAVCDIAYTRWVSPYCHPVDGYEYAYEPRRAFYEELFAARDFELVWESPQKYNMNAQTNPKIKLYRRRAR